MFKLRSGCRASSAARDLSHLRRSVLILWTLWALPGWGLAVPTPPTVQLPFTPPFCDQGCAIADLDGDGRPDLAIARVEGWGPSGYRYRIDLDLTTRVVPSSFSVFAERGGLSIIPRDVNGDWEPDLIITSAWSFTPVGVWINDGHGGFIPTDSAAYPQSTWGEGPRLFSDRSCEPFQATVPGSHWSWPDSHQGAFFYNELLTKRLTLPFPAFRPPSGFLRVSQTRGPPYPLKQTRRSST
jgi:hypothetical protein